MSYDFPSKERTEFQEECATDLFNSVRINMTHLGVYDALRIIDAAKEDWYRQQRRILDDNRGQWRFDK